MSDDIDPEVLADLRLRASSQHDRSRARPSLELLGSWTPDEKPAGMWRCKGRGKGKEPCPSNSIVPVSADTIERLMMFNQRLRKLGEDPIDTDDVVRCVPCQRSISAARSNLLRQRVEEMAALIRVLKGSSRPRKEELTDERGRTVMINEDGGQRPVLIVERLRQWNHPDVDGLLQALEDQSKTGKSNRRVSKDSI